MTIEQLLKEVENMEFKSTTEVLKEIEEDMNNRTEEQIWKGQMVIEEMRHQDMLSNKEFKKQYGYNKLDY